MNSDDSMSLERRSIIWEGISEFFPSGGHWRIFVDYAGGPFFRYERVAQARHHVQIGLGDYLDLINGVNVHNKKLLLSSRSITKWRTHEGEFEEYDAFWLERVGKKYAWEIQRGLIIELDGLVRHLVEPRLGEVRQEVKYLKWAITRRERKWALEVLK